MTSFASDNYHGAHFKIVEAMAAANGTAKAYGDDAFTQKAKEAISTFFEQEVKTYFVFNGTAANVLAIKAACKPYEAVLCSEHSHIHMDEGGAPEQITGCKLIPLPTVDGKITGEALENSPIKMFQGCVHHVQPKLLSITQSTELGTVYSLDELAQLGAFAKEHNLKIHMDGARFFNALVSLGCSPKQMVEHVDVLSFGATKNGTLFGEAVVFFDHEMAQGFEYIQKSNMQLLSKNQFIATQYLALLKDELWKSNAENANAMAKYLADSLKDVHNVHVMHPVQANAVFAQMPMKNVQNLQQKFPFYVWDESQSLVRWMCAFDTTKEEVDAFVEAIQSS